MEIAVKDYLTLYEMNSNLLLIGPNFHDFNKYIERAFVELGWVVSTIAYDTPIHPYTTINKIRYKLSGRKDGLKEKSRQVFSKKAITLFESTKPQMVFMLNGDMLTFDAVQFMRKTSKIIVWLFDSITRLPDCWNIISHCDKVFCYEQDDIPLIQDKLSINADFLSQAVDPKAYYTIPNVEKKWDIVFAADIWKSPRRKKLIQLVVSSFPDCKIRVHGIYKPWYKGFWQWLTRERRDVYTNCNATTEQLNIDYNQARVVLNIHNEQQSIGANPKVYEISATGSYQVCDANPYIEEIFSNGEVGLYHNEKELIEQIHWALNPDNEKEREQKAKQAQAVILSSHTFYHRLQEISEIK
jgi:spore maturation protein CgeB